MNAVLLNIQTILTIVFTGPNWPKLFARDADVCERTARRYRAGEMDMSASKLLALAERNAVFRAELMRALRSLDERDADGAAVPPGSLGASARNVVRADRRLAGAEGGQPAALVTR